MEPTPEVAVSAVNAAHTGAIEMPRFSTVGRQIAVLLVAIVAVLPHRTANSATVGDWFTGSTDDGQLYAGATNESGGFLMKSCQPSSGLCRWILVTATRCEGSTTAPALLSSSRGSAAMEISCDGSVKDASPAGVLKYRYLLHDPDLMDGIVESSTPLGIAVALDNGRFQVYRFSMKGAKDAIAALLEATMRLRKKPGTSTRDTVL